MDMHVPLCIHFTFPLGKLMMPPHILSVSWLVWLYTLVQMFIGRGFLLVTS